MTYRKYGNKPQTIDGLRFDSRMEANRYIQLRVLEKAGVISQLAYHTRYGLVVNNVKIGIYEDDFSYFDQEMGRLVVEDVKGVKTPVYRLKKKLMLALHGIEIVEIN